MDFPTAVKTCLLQKYASFSGRASRPEYWWFFLAVIAGSIIASLLGAAVYLIYTLAVLCPALAAGFRRLQDTGKPGLLIAVPFGISLLATLTTPDVPSEADLLSGGDAALGNLGLVAVLGIAQFLVSLLFLWWLTRPSQPETNAYGPPPAQT